MNISSVGGAAAVALAPAPAVPRPDQQAVVQAVKAVNGAELFGQENELTFVLDRASHQPVVRIVNKSTREMVAQIPSQAVLELAAGLTDKKLDGR